MYEISKARCRLRITRYRAVYYIIYGRNIIIYNLYTLYTYNNILYYYCNKPDAT